MNDVALRANDVMLRIKDVGLRPMMLHYVQMELRQAADNILAFGVILFDFQRLQIDKIGGWCYNKLQHIKGV